jgi:hypothetical protein
MLQHVYIGVPWGIVLATRVPGFVDPSGEDLAWEMGRVHVSILAKYVELHFHMMSIGSGTENFFVGVHF